MIIILLQNNVVLCNIGCSLLASVCVAILIDFADYIKRKRSVEQQQRFLLVEYRSSVQDLIWDMLEHFRHPPFDKLNHYPESLFSEWLDELFDETNYIIENNSEKITPDISFYEMFEWTASYLNRIEKATNYLISEQSFFLYYDIFKQADIKHFKRQYVQCRLAQRYCKKRDIEHLKRYILSIIRSYSKHFDENLLSQQYSLDYENAWVDI